jgi:FtsZ-binding cell division protein ZapB
MMSEQNDQHIMMEVPGKPPVKLGLPEAVNMINSMQQQGQELIRKNSELESIITQLQKQLVKFQMQGGNNNGVPQSNETEKIRKENIELTNKVLTHINNEKLLKMEIQELKSKISNLELNTNTKPSKSNEPLMKPIEIIKERSKLEPEVKVKL